MFANTSRGLLTTNGEELGKTPRSWDAAAVWNRQVTKKAACLSTGGPTGKRGEEALITG